jgi:hypothetical protein
LSEMNSRGSHESRDIDAIVDDQCGGVSVGQTLDGPGNRRATGRVDSLDR